MTDEKGTVKYTYAYNPYGGLMQGSYGQVMFLFNGQYGVASDDNGLYYMRARYYNISIKRFINQDVVTGSIAESQSLNRYAYVEGNPVSYLDPFGLNGTFMAGMQGNITAGILSVYGQVGIANDAQGNKDILVTVGANLGLGMGAGGGIFKNTTNAKTVKDLLGWGLNFGTSAGMPVW